ncbi:16S rRNA (adenine(1518)-N(6)/adenine(1519)-N(6))-dimethyltransferase RsmA [Pelotomaculum propionicicum]|uniref:Ribosomal RNA small subunit methyltransferase A n=1 Tax=Pelotomaculum propionicicum TaxID=258475 RepID=A0A4Y7RVD8_9FIRM|nr:16S rRNA (adenine(1518)-N(6)/adenine(1519)-N(6))-dimethyltransferase RsmA [Pelotomaculum propionicicum]TEB12227.1 Ribosomal RNA small subunit methyltransferase A [Pelotomaculum propionicicum]
MFEAISPAVVRAVMQRFGLSCRKSLGQNFLVDSNIINKIIAAAELTAADLVVEIGPGLGALTGRIAGRAGRVLAVEVDKGLLPALSEMLAGAGVIEVIEGDALKIDFDRLVWEKTGGEFGRGRGKYKLMANLPYYITSPLIMHLLMNHFNLSMIIVMVQLEVAARMTALPGTKAYGALSLAVQYFTEPKMLFRVPRTVFFPQPDVDSAVVRLSVRPSPAVRVASEEEFFKIIRASFGQRRKTLLNSLTGSNLGLDKESFLRALKKSGIDHARRGETLSLAEFAVLTGNIMELKGEV